MPVKVKHEPELIRFTWDGWGFKFMVADPYEEMPLHERAMAALMLARMVLDGAKHTDLCELARRILYRDDPKLRELKAIRCSLERLDPTSAKENLLAIVELIKKLPELGSE